MYQTQFFKFNVDKIKVCTYLMKQSSTLFSCSVCSMNNRVHGTKKMSHVKNIHSWDQLLDLSKETLLQSFSENPVNELHDWIDKHPNVIQSPNVSDSIFQIQCFKKETEGPALDLSTRAIQ